MTSDDMPFLMSSPPSVGERFVVLALNRRERVQPMSMSKKPQKGDEAIVAIHTPEREEAFRILEAMGWWEIPEPVDGDEDLAESAAGDKG